MIRVMIEATHDPPLTQASLESLNQRAGPCLKAFNIRRLRMLIAPDGRRTLCEIAAPDADTVRAACRQAGISFDHIWTADVLESPLAVAMSAPSNKIM